MPKINQVKPSFDSFTACISKPYVTGAKHISSAIFKKYRLDDSTTQKFAIDPPLEPATYRKIPLSHRVRQLCYGLILMIPVINHIIDLAFSILHQKKSQKALSESLKLPRSNKPSPDDAFIHNLNILKTAYEAAGAQDKKLISLMAANYLNHVTPKHVTSWSNEIAKIDPHYVSPEQSSPFQEYRYHREILDQKLDYGKRFNAKLAFGNQSLFLATDTIQIQHSFAIKFSVMSMAHNSLFSTINYGSSYVVYSPIIAKAFQYHIRRHLEDNFSPKKRLADSEKMPILLDLTSFLGSIIITSGHPSKDRLFQNKFAQAKQFYYSCLTKEIKSFIAEHKELKGQNTKLLNDIINSTTCITRTEVEGVAGIKILPFGKYKTREQQFSSPLIEYMIRSGSSIGAINLRKLIPDVFVLTKDAPNLGKASQKLDITLYPNKDSLSSSFFYKRLSKLFCCDNTLSFEELQLNKVKPQYLLFGKATINLINGLFCEISQKNWLDVRENPVRNYICQTALHQIFVHFCNAEKYYIENKFDFFMQEIEIINAEIQKLLTLFSPFNPSDFDAIIKKQLIQGTIPTSLQENAKAGIGRSATNVFACITACAKEMSSQFTSVYAEESYFEQSWFMQQKFDVYLADPSRKKLNLYHAQFNPNVNVGSELISYKRHDIAHDLRVIFANNCNADNFTAAIDVTIDDFSSKNIHDLLNEFKKEINEGKINFVFFSSGQKFNTLGMDNYYGSSFFMVNNSASKWGCFQKLFSHPCYQTDRLSYNFFCLSSKYCCDALSSYRKLIFKNTRSILDRIPQRLHATAKEQKPFRVNLADKDMLPAFIDIKVLSPPQDQHNQASRIQQIFMKIFVKRKIPVYQRGSFGFFHCNFAVFGHCDDKVRTVRINPGVNSDDIPAFMEFFASI